jgi:molecular chaperone DnaJ
VHIEVQTPKNLDVEQEALLRKLAVLRGEERPQGTFAPGQQGLFSRLKDAINNR